MNIEGKRIVVTGAGSGIGAACARRFASEGAKVAVVDIDKVAADAVAEEIDGVSFECNLGAKAEIDRFLESLGGEFGDVDILFSNAGIATGGGLLDTDVEVWEHQWNVNMMAHVHLTKALLPSMLERKAGYLIYTASMAGYLSSHGLLPYAVTKHAVVGFAEWLAFTYHQKGIRTSLLAPLVVKTPMAESVSGILPASAGGEATEPADLAKMVIDAVKADQFLILSNELAHTWMKRKSDDLDRWLSGMRRIQSAIDGEKD